MRNNQCVLICMVSVKFFGVTKILVGPPVSLKGEIVFLENDNN